MYRLFFVLISLVASQSFAADVANLYQSQLPVSSQSEQLRDKRAPEILRQVILKVVGDRSALDARDLTPLLKQTPELIQNYKYHQINSMSDDVTEPQRLEVLLSFNQVRLNDALSELGLPIWGQSRPEVLIWVAVERSGNRSILSADDTESTITKALNYAAFMRGLPMLLPVMDLQDQSQVTFTDLWAGFSDTIETASQRYGTPVTLMLKLTISDNGLVRADWHARISGKSEQWQSRGDVDTAIRAGIDELTDRLSRQFTQVVTNQYENKLSLEINNVKTYADYTRAMSYLAKLQYVSTISLVSLAEDKLLVDVSFQGDIAVFDRTLVVDRVLMENAAFGFNENDIKRYQLAP